MGQQARSQAGTVLVAGGGIGGLAAALCLARAGFAVEVYEAAREVRALGVGINLLPHSVRVLRDLGLQGELAASGIETAELVYVNKFGQRIWQEPRGLAAGYAVPQYSIHRGELQMILFRSALARLPAGRFHPGCALVDFTQDAEGVTAVFEDRERGGARVEARGACLVAADGIHSTARRKFYSDEGPPRFSGRMLWRAITEMPALLDGRTMVWAGHERQKFVCYPISEPVRAQGRSLVNWIAELRVAETGSTPPRSDWNREVDKSVFREPFAGWDFGWLSVPALIDGAQAVYEFPMADRDPVPRWTHGRVTLLGDAAHPMYPVGSNGASQAILDAEELAAQFAAKPVEAALEAYDEARRPATAAIVLANRQGGPDRVLQIAEERAPQGFARIEDVIPRAELEAIAQSYKRTAGFDREAVNKKSAGQA
ncbi:MAG TPA: flavin-dependent oxidoreductase [Burkholderiales bacterium]|nr:flavin-dependent oxidoreductase [Burkholderiales bacterium]